MLPKFGRGVCFWLIDFPLLWVLRIKPGARFTLGKCTCPAFRIDLNWFLLLISRGQERVDVFEFLMLWPDVVVHTCNLSTQGGLQILGQPKFHGDSPSQIILFNISITVEKCIWQWHFLNCETYVNNCKYILPAWPNCI